MIKLSISAGHAWSVWDDRGGLQPTVESLAIPPEISEKIEAWSDRLVSPLWAPIYTRRKEFDAEGRKLVAELQRAVGDRFHVSFRSWVTFDPKHWRTLWRDEDLFSGASEENWFNDDLPDEVVVKVVKIYPDFGGAYLWDMNGWGIGNDAPAFPDELDERFMAWANLWDEAYNFDTHQVDRWRLSRIGFDQQGIDLAVELKRAVGTATKVIYCCQLREPALEVFEGGSTIEWPRNTDFRQWALDSVQGGKDKK